jgi:hypothetical protein
LQTSQRRADFAFLHSKSYYIILLVAAAGVQADYVLTIEGISHGYTETRPLFWLHFVGLFALITAMFAIMHPVNRMVAERASLAAAIVLPALPITSNVLVLMTGSSPFV